MAGAKRKIAVTGAMVLGGIIVFWIARKGIKRMIERHRSRQFIKDLENEAGAFAKTETLSHPLTEYEAMSRKLVEAGEGCGTTDDSVMAVFDRVKNNRDLLQLKSTFGTRKWDACNWTDGWWAEDSGTLDDFIAQEMSPREINTINAKLTGKGIVYQF